jgi:hypothetical protein
MSFRDGEIDLRLQIAVTNLGFMQNIKCSKNLCSYDPTTFLCARSVLQQICTQIPPGDIFHRYINCIGSILIPSIELDKATCMLKVS